MFTTLAYVRKSTAGLPRTFWFLWVGTLINRIGVFVQPFLTLFLTLQRGLTPEEAAVVISLQGIGSFGAHFVGGYLSDHVGRRGTMLLSFFGTPVLLILLYGAQDRLIIAALALCFGFFIDLYRPASSALIADIVPQDDRVRAYALRYWAINLGAAVGLALGGFLAQRGYELLFIGDALTTFLFGLVVLAFVPETRPTTHEAGTAQPLMPSEAGMPKTSPKFRAALVFTLLFSFVNTLFGLIYMQINVTVPLAMRARGLTEADYGLSIAFNGLLIVLISLPVNQYLRRYQAMVVIAGSAILSGIGFGVYAIAYTLPVFVLGVMIWTIGELTAAPLATTVVANISPPERRGLLQGIFGSSFGIASAIGPIIGAVIFQRLGAEALWFGCLILGILVALIFLFVCRPLYERLLTN
jgi:MFS family permease